MSVTINRSNTKEGSGVMSAITIASMASGTTSSPSFCIGRARIHAAAAEDGMVFEGVMGLAGQSAFHEFENVRENFGDRAVEVRRNLLADIDRFIEGLRQ